MYVSEEKRAGHFGTGKKYEHKIIYFLCLHTFHNIECLLLNECFYHYINILTCTPRHEVVVVLVHIFTLLITYYCG